MVELYPRSGFGKAYYNLVGDVLKLGNEVVPRKKMTRELTDVILELDGDEPLILIPTRTSFPYLIRELNWYLSRDTNVDRVAEHAQMWRNAANPDGTANSNYGDAILNPRATSFGPDISEMEWVVGSLLEDKSSRQAVMVIHRPDHHWAGNKDVPCTLNMRFRIRKDQLEAWAHMRSCDLWWGLPYDVNWFKLVHRAVYAELIKALTASKVPNDLRMGPLRIQLDSAHLYERHWAKAEQLIGEQPLPQALEVPWYLPDAMEALAAVEKGVHV